MEKRMGMAQGLPSPILRPVTLNDTFEVNNITCIQNRIRQRIVALCINDDLNTEQLGL